MYMLIGLVLLILYVRGRWVVTGFSQSSKDGPVDQNTLQVRYDHDASALCAFAVPRKRSDDLQTATVQVENRVNNC